MSVPTTTGPVNVPFVAERLDIDNTSPKGLVGLAVRSRSGSVTPAKKSASVKVKAVSSVPFDEKANVEFVASKVKSPTDAVGNTGISLKLRIFIPTD